MKTIKTNKNEYKLICGMEIHAELKTKSKMFCGCKNDPFGAEHPNIYTCPTCLGMPGGLPVANKKAIEWTIKVGLALGCKINLFSKFDRKNYFYPDLPKAYQISQYDLPFCYDGVVETSLGPVRITRIHLEEDTGKLQHTTVNGKKVSLIDYNRSSVPLMEIVTEPDIKSPEHAKEYAKKIRDTLRYLEVADCDMDQGGMRLEANISLAKKSAKDLPDYKVEVKNINSFRFAEQAIEFEMHRQAKVLDENKTPVQETRGYDSVKSITFSQRTKEDAEDYRYFPDPDLPPIEFTKEQIDTWKAELPELPDAVMQRWQNDFSVETRYSELLIDGVSTVNLLDTIFKTLSEESGKKLQPNSFANMLANKKLDIKISSENASNLDIQKIIDEFKKLYTTDDVPEEELTTTIQKVMLANQDAVEKYKSGQKQVVGFFIGQTLRELGKKVDSKQLAKLISRELSR